MMPSTLAEDSKTANDAPSIALDRSANRSPGHSPNRSRGANAASDLWRRARTDSLTGLLNRESMKERFEAILHDGGPDAELALIYIDLDRFKPVNDTLGHGVGDAVLKTIAQRLSGRVRPTDAVGRLGGDEFAVLQCGVAQPTGSRVIARRVIEAIEQPIVIDGQHVSVGGSVGVAIAPYDGETYDELLSHADLALYRAKDDGRGIVRYFEPSMSREMEKRRAMELKLRRAVTEEQFELFYQPICDVTNQSVTNFEALIRWRDPAGGYISPDQFIPLAEETGLIHPIGHWVLRTACAEAARWALPVRVAVNLSPLQLRDRTLVDKVVAALRDADLPPDRLELEITETSLIDENDLTLSMLHQFRGYGIHVALDDFGTGYSSINYLRRFPFDKIKIDRSFVSGPDEKGNNESLVKMIASLGTAMGVRTTAEGVETIEQMDSVRLAGCTDVQGYLLSRPMAATDLQTFLANSTPPPPRDN